MSGMFVELILLEQNPPAISSKCVSSPCMELFQEVDVEVDEVVCFYFYAAWIFACGLLFSFLTRHQHYRAICYGRNLAVVVRDGLDGWEG